MDIKEGDHLVLDQLGDDGFGVAHKIEPGGQVESLVYQAVDEGDPSGNVFVERCRGDMHHVTRVGTGHSGPARFNCEAYRDGYDRIFGSR